MAGSQIEVPIATSHVGSTIATRHNGIDESHCRLGNLRKDYRDSQR
jgi:hypothetical protein